MEDCYNCPSDCDSSDGSPICGNGFCEPGEHCENCASDCASQTKGKKSNQFCCFNDLIDTLPSDFVGCGDARCACSPEPPIFCNGDGFCDIGETGCTEPACGGPAAESCSDGLDNDCDG